MKKHSSPLVLISRATVVAVALCAALFLSAIAPAQAADAGRSAGGSSSASDSTASDATSRAFILRAGKSGMMEVRLSQLALERTADSKVRACAQAIVTDHQRANAELSALANRRGIMLPIDTASASLRMRGETAAAGGAREPVTTTSGAAASGTGSADFERVSEEVQEAVNRLSRETGAEFDRAYLEQMAKGHDKAIALFEEQSKRTSDQELASFAQATLPILREHLSQVKTIQREQQG